MELGFLSHTIVDEFQVYSLTVVALNGISHKNRDMPKCPSHPTFPPPGCPPCSCSPASFIYHDMLHEDSFQRLIFSLISAQHQNILQKSSLATFIHMTRLPKEPAVEAPAATVD